MYRHCYWDKKRKDVILATWDKNGNRKRVHVPFKQYLYVENPEGEYTSIFGTKLKKVEFATSYDREQFKIRYGGKKFYDDFGVEQQFLLDAYWDKVGNDDFAERPLRTLFFDIEVDPLPGGEFPAASLAKAEINIITAYDYLDKTYHVFTKRDYRGKSLGDNVRMYSCATEKQLLRAFLEFWKKDDYPDIVSGWNSATFDIPYLCNRIIKVLGEDAFNSLSPYENIFTVEKEDKFGKSYDDYRIAGITLLDWMEVYAKYKVTKQESYKLDFIANMELGIGKVDYQGMTIYEFMEKDWDKFVEYNVRDVELLVKLEAKLKYYAALRLISYSGCMNFEKCLATIPQTNGALAVICRQRGICLNMFDRKGETHGVKPGGFVSSTPGFHENVITLDCNSMYPNTCISNNISPETIVGLVTFKFAKLYDGEMDDEAVLKLVNGRTLEINRKQLLQLMKEKNLILSANGALFRQDREGILAQFMREVYEKRVEIKKEIKVLNKEENALNAELTAGVTPERRKEIEERLARIEYLLESKDAAQFVLKIRINSAYGAVSSPMNPMGSDDLANAITMMGSTSIQQVNVFAKQYVHDKCIAIQEEVYKDNPTKEEKMKLEALKRMTLKDYDDVIVFNDTDSCGFSLTRVPIKMFRKHDGLIEVTEEGYALENESCSWINDAFIKWYIEKTNTKNCRMVFKREKICDIGIWLKKGGKSNEEAKKNYVCRVIDNEGVQHFDGKYVKYTGVKLARSVIPKAMKNAAKETIWTMLDSRSRTATDNKVRELWNTYCNMHPDDKAAIQKANGIEKYKPEEETYGLYLKGTPGHIKPALNYNFLINALGIKRLQPIVSGDTYKIVHVKPNKWGFDKFAYLEEWPKEFDGVLEIDNVTGFNKLIYEEIKRFYKTVDWPAFNPADNYEFSLMDILEL